MRLSGASMGDATAQKPEVKLEQKAQDFQLICHRERTTQLVQGKEAVWQFQFVTCKPLEEFTFLLLQLSPNPSQWQATEKAVGPFFNFQIVNQSFLGHS